MNNIITLGEFVEILKKTDFFKEQTDSESIVSAFFQSITDALKTDDSVSIKGFGDFAVISRESGLVLFTPDRSMADTINEPFAFFEPIELADVITDEMLDKAADDTPEKADNEPKPTETTEATETVKTAEIIEPVVEEPVIKETPVEIPVEISVEPEQPIVEKTEEKVEEKVMEKETEPEQPVVEETAVPEENKDKDEDEEKEDEYNNDDIEDEVENEEDEDVVYQPVRRGHSTFALVAYMLLGIAIGFVIGLFTAEYIFADDEEEADDSELIELVENETVLPEETPLDETAVNDSAEPESQPTTEAAVTEEKASAPVQPAATTAVITDTVRSNHYLTHMSRRFYGGATEFWVYIYIENQDKLGHPDRLRPNTVVVIPPAEKYGIDPNSQQSRDAAKKKVSEIYAKFK